MDERERLGMVAQTALKTVTPSMREIAEEAGIAYSTLRAWSAGNRFPSPEGRAALAKALRRRAGVLEELAGELEGAAE